MTEEEFSRDHAGLVFFTSKDLDRLSNKLAAPTRMVDETDADFRNRLITYFSKLPAKETK